MHTPSRRSGAFVRLFAGASLVALAVSGVALAGEAAAPQAAVQAPQTAPEPPQTADSAPVAKPDGAVEEVVVTGFRASLRSAIQQKRTSDQIVESISAEDIGKLPDNSIAESIARLPGITAQRLDGRDSVISIRGFSPDFSTTLLNGREQVSTGNNRAAEFDQYPSELIAGVVVYKTPEAGLVGQGLSGTVDLRTIRPLDYKKRVLGFNARGEINTLNSTSENGYRVSGTYVDQFANDTIGLSIGVAREESPNRSNRYRVWGYPNGPNGSLLPGGFVALDSYGQLERTGVSSTLQWRPNSKLSSTLDVYYSDYFNTQDFHGMEGGLGYSQSPTSLGASSDGIYNSGTYDQFRFVGRHNLNSRQANLYAAGWNTVYEDGPWKLVGDISFSGVRRRDKVLELYSGTGRSNGNGTFDGITFATDGQGDYTFADSLNRGDPNIIKLTNPQGWGSDQVPGGQDGYYNAPLVRDQLMAYRASAIYTLNQFGIKSVEVGGNFTRRFKDYTPDEFFLALTANQADPTHNTSVDYPASLLQGNASLDFIGGPNVIRVDPIALLSYPGLYSYVRNRDANVAAKSWIVKENVSTVWFKANIDQPFMGGDITGNAGVQVVYTDQSSTGTASSGNPAVITAASGGDTYTEPLPSLSLNYRTAGGDVVRLGVARTLARPRLDQLEVSATIGRNPTYRYIADPSLTRTYFTAGGFDGGAAGNPRLRPYIADGVDLSFEHYFTRDSYISVQPFYKYLESYVYKKSIPYDFSGISAPCGTNELVNGACLPPVQTTGLASSWQNASGGSLYGMEISATTPLTAFAPWVQMTAEQAPWLDGFGLSGSVSYVETDLTPGAPLPGLSRYVGNGTLFYEKNGFSGRVSVRYRSKFLGEVTGFGAGQSNSFSAPETVVDAQFGYTWDSGPLKGLGVLVQGNNLTNEPFQTYYSGDPRQTEYHQEYGQRILFGVSYKY